MKWFPADTSKPPLPFPSRICSLDWVTEPYRAEPPGEVWGEDRRFNHAKKIDGLLGNHFCGTEDEFRNGEVFNPSRPATRYNPSGIPLCCDPHRREADGKGTAMSSSYYTRSHTYRSPGMATVRNATRHVTGHGRTSDAFFAFKYGVTHATDTARFAEVKGAVTNGSHYVRFPVRIGGGLAAGKNGSVWTHSVVCWPITETYLLAPLTWTDHECSTEIVEIGDGTPIFVDGWRRIEVLPDTDYQFRWRYEFGVGIGGVVDVFVGTDAAPVLNVYSHPTIGNSGTGDFNSTIYNRVYVHLQSPASDVLPDNFIQETHTV